VNDIKLTVWIYLNSFSGGGAETVLVTLANGIAKRNYKVTIVVVSSSGPLLDKVSSDVDIIELPVKRTIQAVFPLSKLLRKNKPDILISSVFHSIVCCHYAVKFAHVITKHIIRCASVESKEIEFISLRRVWKWLLRNAYLDADSVIFSCNDLANANLKYLSLNSVGSYKVIPNPIDPDYQQKLLESPPKTVIDLEKKGLKIILGIGRLAHHKGFDVLIKAFAKLPSTEYLQLVIAGDGQDKETLTKLAELHNLEHKVTFLGYVNNPYSLFQSSTIFVLPSRYEGLPNALIQALSSGIRIVATNCETGPSEILDNGRLGSLVPVDDSNSMSRAIWKSLDEGKLAYNAVEETRKYHYELWLNSYAEIIDNCVDKM